jgi:hypothetical protein
MIVTNIFQLNEDKYSKRLFIELGQIDKFIKLAEDYFDDLHSFYSMHIL